MSEKMIVTFKALPVFGAEVDYLSYCRKCNTYGLRDRPCSQCGGKDNITLEKVAEKIARKRLLKQEMIVLAGCFLIVLLMQSLTGWIVLMGICLAGLNGLIYIKYKKALINRELDRYLKCHTQQIKGDLDTQLQAATDEVEKGDLLAAYERLRYLSQLMDNEKVRTFKLICLRNFSLRSDMPLEMDTILQKDYSMYLVDYIYEVSKVRKDLIDEAAILYILQYKEQVLEKRKGKQIIASVLEAALRSQYLFKKYATYMPGYVQYFSKERMRRLVKINTCLRDDVLRDALLQEVRENIN